MPAQEINAGIVLGAHSEPETSPWPSKVALNETAGTGFERNSRHQGKNGRARERGAKKGQAVVVGLVTARAGDEVDGV